MASYSERLMIMSSMPSAIATGMQRQLLSDICSVTVLSHEQATLGQLYHDQVMGKAWWSYKSL